MDGPKIFDVNKLTKYPQELIYNVTCVECCKYYVAPNTALCGHTLCQLCWRFRHTCPLCGLKVEKNTLESNLFLQELTKHFIQLKKTFEELFQINLDETSNIQHISEWLPSSQNQLSAKVSTSQDFIQESIQSVQKITSEVQIHTKYDKLKEPEKKIVCKNYQQIDWDKIEEMSDVEVSKDYNNVVGPMDVETFNFMDGKEYAISNPRRSSRKINLKSNSPTTVLHDISTNTKNEKFPNIVSEKKSNKDIQVRNKLKRMKRDLGNFKNKNTNKLNFSIEECKNSSLSSKNRPVRQQAPYNINDCDLSVVNTEYSKSSPIKNFNNDNNINKEINKNKDLLVSNVVTNTVMNKSNSNDLENNSSVFELNNVQQYDHDVQNNDKNDDVNKNIQYSKVSFFKRGPLNNKTMDNKTMGNNTIHIDTNNTKNVNTDNTDDIEISIRIGNTLTNICIKKKENDVQFKINSDREIQTSLSTSSLNVEPKVDGSMKQPNIQYNKVANVVKSNKNTASADTSTIHNEITESVEKQLVDHLDSVQFTPVNSQKLLESDEILKTTKQWQPVSENLEVIPADKEFSNDADIFEGDSVKGNVTLLKSSTNTPSVILMPTCKSVTKSQKNAFKRAGDNSVMKDFSKFKKAKISQKALSGRIPEEDSELINYDNLMSQVFANIDADIENLPKNAKRSPISNIQNSHIKRHSPIITSEKGCINQKCSENIFSLIEKEDLNTEIPQTNSHNSLGSIEQPNKISQHTKESNYKKSGSDMDIELSTPVQDDEDDDKSVVEETPQKSVSLLRNKSKIEGRNVMDAAQSLTKGNKSINEIEKQNITHTKKNIGISDSLHESVNSIKNITVMETPRPSSNFKSSLKKFVDEIKYKSTPVARKSLNLKFKSVDIDLDKDPEETLCPSTLMEVKTTQEREFMSKAFEQNLYSPTQTLLVEKKCTKLCVACSCLTLSEKANLQNLCLQRNWSFVEKYTQDLTHLVVAVDEENKAQRSIKYMCTLASGKWIISYRWVEKCLSVKGVVDEDPFEVLDFTGEPGPRRSRLSKQKLFKGIIFYCMPPFSILDVITLKEILETSGGRVVDDVSGVRKTAAPALLLAEPENTQEDRFIYLAMELNIVPVNYEWILNCLGSYILTPINELLLCPESLLPPATSKWPPDLISRSAAHPLVEKAAAALEARPSQSKMIQPPHALYQVSLGSR